MQTRAELFGPYMAAAEMDTYGYYIVLSGLDILPPELVGEIIGRIWAPKMMETIANFNAIMRSLFMSKLFICTVNIEIANSDALDMMKSIAPDLIADALDLSCRYRICIGGLSILTIHWSTLVDIFRAVAANFTSVNIVDGRMVIEL